MGMEIVELIMLVEERFSIEITDAEAELLGTPGAVCDLVAYKLGIGPSSSPARSYCPSSRAFYAIRRELMTLGIERQRITPGTSLVALWPRSERRHNWEALGNALNYKLPPLRRSPEWAFVGLLPLSVLPIALLFSPATGAALCVFYAALWWLGFHVTKPFATHIPEEMNSVADLTRHMVPRFCTSDSASVLDVWSQVRRLIADEFAIPIELVKRDADFYRDLGLG